MDRRVEPDDDEIIAYSELKDNKEDGFRPAPE